MKFKISTNSISTKKQKERLYLILFEDSTGSYVKCGKSSGDSSHKRFISIMESYIIAHKGNCAYAKLLRDVEVDDVFIKETAFHNKFKDKRHYPKHSFSGYTELFSLDVDEAITAFDSIVNSKNEIIYKECYSCKELKPSNEFTCNSSKKDKLNHKCKICTKETANSFSQLPYRIYSNQIEHSKTRGHPAPAYTYEEFKKWIISNNNYAQLYEKYKNSGYDKNLVPSIDRIDPKKPYLFSNIQVITFKENMTRNAEAIKETQGIKINAYFADSGRLAGSFVSQNTAARILNLNGKSIYKIVDTVVKQGYLRTHKGYQLVSVNNLNRFTDNESIKDEFRYKGNKYTPQAKFESS